MYVNLGLVTAGKFFDTAVFQQAFLYTSEMMPTPVRNVAVGTCSMVARVGCVVTPYLVELLVSRSFMALIFNTSPEGCVITSSCV